MNRKLQISILLISFILFGCSSPSTVPTAQPIPEETRTPSLAVPTITVIPSATNDPDSPESCIDLSLGTLNATAVDGLLAVRDSRSKYHLYDPKTKQTLDVDTEGNQTFYPGLISPNKKYMLAQDDKYNYLLRTADKVIRTNISLPTEWVGKRWLDNERLVFLSVKEPQQDLIIWNPFTEVQQSIHLDLPNPMIEQYAPGARVIYSAIDPTLKRVIFNNQAGKLILWDIETKKEVASLAPPTETPRSSTSWSPDGKKFVTPWPEGSGENPLANELYVFDMDGVLKQLTNLNQEYALANVESPVWSPDGHHIGFWVKIGDTNSNLTNLRQWLAVLDTDTLETTIYCLADKHQPWQAHGIGWSPDGQKLIVSFGSPLEHVVPILVDLAHKTQSVIDTQNMLVENWMAP